MRRRRSGPRRCLRFDHGKKTYALIRDAGGKLFATDGFAPTATLTSLPAWSRATSSSAQNTTGVITWPRFACARAHLPRPRHVPHRGSRRSLYLNSSTPAAPARAPRRISLPRSQQSQRGHVHQGTGPRAARSAELIAFTPGDYLQLDIPSYECDPLPRIRYSRALRDRLGESARLRPGRAQSRSGRRNNYSLASNQQTERTLRFNVRIATPPPGQDCPPGVGSSYVFSLKPGDIVTAIGPFGDFHIKPTQREMVYIGGGAGMAPLRAHLSHLFDTERPRAR